MVKKILRENYIYITLIVILTILLTMVMKSSLLDNIVSFDYNFVSFMKDISGDSLTSIFKIITNFGDIYIPLVILLLIFMRAFCSYTPLYCGVPHRVCFPHFCI